MAKGTATSKEAEHRRWERHSRLARRVGSMLGGPVERRIERFLLRRSWRHFEPKRLKRYLVRGYQNPVINMQSIVARHELVRELYGDVHEGLMVEEMQWAAEKYRAYAERRKAILATSGMDDKERSVALRTAYKEVMADSELYANRWSEALGQPPSSRLAVIEAACGSANDYRFFVRYGLSSYLNYTGFDITDANIANARRMFPGVDFRIGDVQDIEAADGSYDWAIAHDLLEHLAPRACNRAIDELCRVSRGGVLISFFSMADQPEHQVQPRRHYHVNTLSKARIHERFAEHCSDIRWLHIRPFVAEHTGFARYYNSRAWTIIARH